MRDRASFRPVYVVRYAKLFEVDLRLRSIRRSPVPVTLPSPPPREYMPQVPSCLWRSSLLLPLAASFVAAFAPSAFADDTAAALGAVVDRDEFSTTVKSGEAFKTRTYPAPVNFQEDDGSWKAIDRALQVEGDGTVHPIAVDGDAAIPASLGRPVVLEHDGRTLSFRLVGADGDADREVAGTKASFDDVLSGVDVSYKARANGLKEIITLASRASRRTFSFDVAADADLTAKIVDGDLVFTDAPVSSGSVSRRHWLGTALNRRRRQTRLRCQWSRPLAANGV